MSLPRIMRLIAESQEDFEEDSASSETESTSSGHTSDSDVESPRIKIESKTDSIDPELLSANRINLINAINLHINLICIKNGGVKHINKKQVLHPLFYQESVEEEPLDIFIHGLARLSRASEQSLIGMVILLHRYAEEKDLNYLNVNMLIVVSLMLASKVFQDECFQNVDFAGYVGEDIKVINELEREFLDKIDYKTFITSDQFSKMVSKLETTQKEKQPKYIKDRETRYDVALLDGGIVLPVALRMR